MNKPFPAALLMLVPSERFESPAHELAGMIEGCRAAGIAAELATSDEERVDALRAVGIASRRAQAAWEKTQEFDGRPWYEAYPIETSSPNTIN